MLQTIQNLSVDIKDTENRTRYGGNRLDPDIGAAWRKQLSDLNRSRQVMREQAAAIGIPEHSIDHVQARGVNGIRWRSNQVIPETAAPDRAYLLDRVGQHVRRLEDMAAIRAAYSHRFGHADPDLQSFLDARMTVLRNHIGAVAHALEITAAERDQLWSTDHPRLQQALAARMAGYDNDTLTARWLEYASIGELLAAEVRLEALTNSGLSLPHAHAAGHMPPSPQQLIALAATALNTAATESAELGNADATTPGAGRGNGGAIGEAIAAGISPDAIGAAADLTTGQHQTTVPVTTEHGIEL